MGGRVDCGSNDGGERVGSPDAMDCVSQQDNTSECWVHVRQS